MCLAALLPGLAVAQSTNAADSASAGSDTAAVAVPSVPDLGRDSFKKLFQNNIFDSFRIKRVIRTNPPPVLRESLTFNGGGDYGSEHSALITAPGTGRADSGGRFYHVGEEGPNSGLKVVSANMDSVELQSADGSSFTLTPTDSLMRENRGPWHANNSYGMMNQDDTGGGSNGFNRTQGGGSRNNQRGGGRQRGGGNNGGYGGGGYGGGNNGGYGGGGGYNNGGGNFGGGYNNGEYAMEAGTTTREADMGAAAPVTGILRLQRTAAARLPAATAAAIAPPRPAAAAVLRRKTLIQ